MIIMDIKSTQDVNLISNHEISQLKISVKETYVGTL